MVNRGGGFSGNRGPWKQTGGRPQSSGGGGFNNVNQGNYGGNNSQHQGFQNPPPVRNQPNLQGQAQGTNNFPNKITYFSGVQKQCYQSCFLGQNAGPRGKRPNNFRRKNNNQRNERKAIK